MNLNKRAARALELEVTETGRGVFVVKRPTLKDLSWGSAKWHPDTDIAQAWLLVEKCRELGFIVLIEQSGWTCYCKVHKFGASRAEYFDADSRSSAAEAITTACILAIESLK